MPRQLGLARLAPPPPLVQLAGLSSQKRRSPQKSWSVRGPITTGRQDQHLAGGATSAIRHGCTSGEFTWGGALDGPCRPEIYLHQSLCRAAVGAGKMPLRPAPLQILISVGSLGEESWRLAKGKLVKTYIFVKRINGRWRQTWSRFWPGAYVISL